MLKLGKKLVIVFTLSLFMLVLFCPNIFAADYTIKAAIGHTPDSPWVKGMYQFEEYLEELSDGRMSVEIFHSGTLGTTREITEMAKSGAIQIAVPGSAQLSTYTNVINLTVLPYIFKSNELMFEALDGPIGEFINKELEKNNLLNLGWFHNGFRSVTNNKRPIMNPEDMKGLKIRVLPSDTVIAYFKALGAVPIHVDWNELYQAMKMGVVEAQENPPFFVYNGRMYEVNQYYSFTEHMNEPGIVVMNKEYFDNLPEDIQLLITTAARKATLWERKDMTETNEKMLEKIKEAGVKVNDIPEENMQKFRQIAYEEVYPNIIEKEMCGPKTKELINLTLWYQEIDMQF